MFIVIIMTGIYRARLAASMSPKAWRVIHASAYAAWIFGLVHGLLGGRPAKSFFGFSGFVAWSYGACVVAVSAALMVRLVGQGPGGQRAGQPPRAGQRWHRRLDRRRRPDGGRGAPGAAALSATAVPAPALAAGSPGALDGARARSRQPGRAQLALPAGGPAARSVARRAAPCMTSVRRSCGYRRIGATGPIGRARPGRWPGPGSSANRAGHPRARGPVRAEQLRAGSYGHNGPAAGRPVRADRPDAAGHPLRGGGSQHEPTGQTDRPGPYAQPPQGRTTAARFLVTGWAGSQAAYGPSSGSAPPAPLRPGPAQYGQPGSPVTPGQHDQSRPLRAAARRLVGPDAACRSPACGPPLRGG